MLLTSRGLFYGHPVAALVSTHGSLVALVPTPFMSPDRLFLFVEHFYGAHCWTDDTVFLDIGLISDWWPRICVHVLPCGE